MQTLVNDTKSLCFVPRFDAYERNVKRLTLSAPDTQLNGKAREYEITSYLNKDSVTKCYIIEMNNSVQYSYNKNRSWLLLDTYPPFSKLENR